jgi:serine/threonine-protein kinase HipA
MINSKKLVGVFFEEQIVGRIALTPEFVCAFEYDTGYLKTGISISPFYLPLKPGVFVARWEPFNGLFGVFNDSLPDGWGRLLTDRFLKRQNIEPSLLTVLDRLCLVGKNGMGALSFKPEWTFTDTDTGNDLNALAKEVELILHNNYTGNLEALYQKGGSSGGARPKVLVNIDGEDWLIKFRASDDPDDIGHIEYEYSLTAKKCGIDMPETKLFEGKYFGTRRFDNIGPKRYHVHSASGLLYASYRYPSLDYTELIKATLSLTRNIEEAYKLFRQMVFNVLTYNRDDHARNFSFILKDDEWLLSPAYDLVLSKGFNGQHTTTIAGNGTPMKADMFEVAKQTGLSEKKVIKIFDEVYENSNEIRKFVK